MYKFTVYIYNNSYQFFIGKCGEIAVRIDWDER